MNNERLVWTCSSRSAIIWPRDPFVLTDVIYVLPVSYRSVRLRHRYWVWMSDSQTGVSDSYIPFLTSVKKEWFDLTNSISVMIFSEQWFSAYHQSWLVIIVSIYQRWFSFLSAVARIVESKQKYGKVYNIR